MYVVTEIPPLPNGKWRYALGVNSVGQVVGHADDGGTSEHPFLWSGADGIQDLGTLGGWEGWAVGIADSGDVVGWSLTSKSQPGKLVARAFLWRAGTMHDLGTLGGENSAAYDINNSGQVVGASNTNTEMHAFLWSEATGMEDLGTLGGHASEALGISDDGRVVGDSLTEKGVQHAFIWDAQAGMVDLGTLAGFPIDWACSINDSGEIAGAAWDAKTDYAYRPLLWNGTGLHDLGSLGGLQSFATKINNAGEVVGMSQSAGFQWNAFYQPRNGPMKDLGQLVGSSGFGWHFGGATDLNDAGQIVGIGGHFNAGRGFLLTRMRAPFLVEHKFPVDWPLHLPFSQVGEVAEGLHGRAVRSIREEEDEEVKRRGEAAGGPPPDVL
jgi:probable HAF family extracellular repeat protein